MRAILLAAGLGSRLRPITENTPKCLVTINGTPLLEIWLNRLSMVGVGPFLINTHYLANQVEAFIKSNRHKDNIILYHEPELKGTAGTLIENLGFYQDEDGMLIHADNYCLANFEAFKEAHLNRPPECLMTMMIFKTTNPSACGIVELDERGVVKGFHEKVENPPGKLANGAIYILSCELIKMFSSGLLTAKDFSNDVIGQLLGRIYTYQTCEIFIDIGTPESYRLANEESLSSN